MQLLNPEDLTLQHNTHTLGIINLIAFVEDNSKQNSNGAEDLLSCLRERVKSKLMAENRYQKMFYLRELFLGIFYWSSNNNLKVEDYCRFTRQYLNKNGTATENDFKTEFNKIINEVLPAENKAAFEILIGRHLISTENGLRYPVSYLLKTCSINKKIYFSDDFQI